MNKIRILLLIRGIGFSFDVEPKQKYSFVNPALLEFFEGVNRPIPKEERIPEEEYEALMKSGPYDAPLYFDKEVYSVLGHKWIWRKGLFRRYNGVRLNFEYEGKVYSETFYVLRRVSNHNIAGVLGRDFNNKLK